MRLFQNVPFSSNYEHVRWFTSRSQQTSYFNSLTSRNLSGGRYLNITEGTIEVENLADTIDVYNYVIIENNNTLNNNVRTYFCFVREIEYVSPNVSRIHFTVDVIQTYMFDLNFKQSFVERQHNNEGANNITPENVNLGSEYQTIKAYENNRDIDVLFNTMLVTATSYIDGSDTMYINSTIIGGVATPLHHYLILIPKDISVDNIPIVNFNGANLYTSTGARASGGQNGIGLYLNIFQRFANENDANKIVGINYLPFFPFAGVGVSKSGSTYNITYVGEELSVEELFAGYQDKYRALRVDSHSSLIISNLIDFNLKTQIETYFNSNGIKEKKLMNYPYVKATLFDSLGGAMEIKPQYLNGDRITVNGLVGISSSPKTAYQVDNYLGRGKVNNMIISNVNADVEVVNDHTATYIQGRKNSDRVAMNQSLVGSVIGFAGGLGVLAASGSTGNMMGVMAGATMMGGAINNGWQGVNTIMAKHEDIQSIPPSIQTQAGASNLLLGHNLMTPRVEIQVADIKLLKKIDNYFKMYGTSQNTMTEILLTSRTHYNFIKTIGANITGSVPTKHMEKIKSVFDAGVTLWHTNDMYNYNVSNNER